MYEYVCVCVCVCMRERERGREREREHWQIIDLVESGSRRYKVQVCSPHFETKLREWASMKFEFGSLDI